MRSAVLSAVLLLTACKGDDPSTDTGSTVDTETTPVVRDGGLVGDGLANPFPSALLLDEAGQLDLSVDDLPSGGSTPLPVERLRWRTGFSAGQTSVLTGVDIDGPLPTVGTDAGTGSVRLLDRTAMAWLPCFAELDAHPQVAADGLTPALIVRPLVALPDGHDIAVAITTEVMDRPEPFDALMSGRVPSDLASYGPRHDAIVADLGTMGLEADELALAWDFPVQHGTRPLATALASEPELLSISLEVDDAPRVPQAWATATGTVTVTGFLDDDRDLRLDPTGAALEGDPAEAMVYVHVPASVADAPAGTVPVLFFGHGIFASPEFYLDDPSDDNGVLALADDLGAIVVGTNWRGLTTPDLFDTTVAATDFGQLAHVTDRLLQAQVNLRALMAGVAEGQLLDEPGLHGASGQVLFDPDQLVYYGISLGGIEGAVLWAEGGAPVDHAALHVGGAMWSTMLERSSNWTLFEVPLQGAVTDPAERQVLFSFSQLLWDPVDPISWVDPLSERDFLLQIAIHDEQVPNFASDSLARSSGLQLLSPEHHVPLGLDTAAGPLQRAYVQFDPEKAAPPPENRPAPVTDAHTTPRDWPGQRQQVVHFLQTGEVQHVCGAEPCTSSNPGTD